MSPAETSSQAPSAIPPRRSSTHHTRGSSSVSDALTSKSTLRAVPESESKSHSQSNSIGHDAKQHSLFTSTDNLPPSLNGGIETAIHANSTTWSQEKEKIVMGPYDYMEDHPGKDIRKQFIAAFNAWLKVPKESLDIITRVVTMLHTASLLIDDVEDSSQLRRGVPVAHSIFGPPQTINSANYVYFTALQELFKLHNPSAIQIYSDELCNLHRGQGMDLFWRDTLTCPSENDYLEMVGNKTGGLFRLAVKLMLAESPTSNTTGHAPTESSSSNNTTHKPKTTNEDTDQYTPLVNTIGLLFQIRDDYLNLASSTYAANKGLCEDLTEGKFSFPVIHSIRANPSNRQLLNILKQKTDDLEVKRYAVKYMESTGSFEYCRVVLAELKRRALDMIERLDQRAGRGSDGVEGAGAKAVKSILDKMDVV